MKRRRPRPLRGQVALISGGAGDIGQAIARVLSAAGVRVAVGDVRPPAEIRTLARAHHYTQVDVTDAASLAGWLARVEQDLGAATLIIPNAAIVEPAPRLQTDLASWQRTLEVNLTGAFLLAQHAAARLVAARRAGRIIFIGSWAAEAPHPRLAAYCAAKAGLRMAMQCLALDLARHDILVNEVAPGRVDAGLSRRIFDRTPGLREKSRREIPVGKLLDPEDVARAVLLLSQPDLTQVTGAVLLLDGGLSLVRAV